MLLPVQHPAAGASRQLEPGVLVCLTHLDSELSYARCFSCSSTSPRIICEYQS